MVSRPFASVVIPTYRRPDMLRRALGSLVAQEDGGWEALVVDDGDGEGAGAAEALGDDRVRATVNAGQGQVDARNTAIALARGEYVCWMDDDDWWEDRGHLGLLRRAAAEGEALFHRSGWLVHEDGRREAFDWPATAASIRENNTVLTSSIAYPRALHRRIGLLDAALGAYCDWDVLLRICALGVPLRKLSGPGVCYAIHAGGVSHGAKWDRMVGLFDKLCEKHGLTAKPHSHVSLTRELSGG